MSLDYQEIDNHQRALLKDAEHRRLVKQIGPTKEKRTLRDLRDATLYRLGMRLAGWGEFLQVRYNPIVFTTGKLSENN